MEEGTTSIEYDSGTTDSIVLTLPSIGSTHSNQTLVLVEDHPEWSAAGTTITSGEITTESITIDGQQLGAKEISALKTMISEREVGMQMKHYIEATSLSWGVWLAIVLVVAMLVWWLPRIGLHQVLWPLKVGGRWAMAKVNAWYERFVEEWRRIE